MTRTGERLGDYQITPKNETTEALDDIYFQLLAVEKSTSKFSLSEEDQLLAIERKAKELRSRLS